jgi:hypothetical protein
LGKISFDVAARRHYLKARQGLDELAVGRRGKPPIHPQQVAKAISDRASEDAVFHLRRRSAHRVGSPLPGDERQATADRVVLARLHGQRDVAGDRGAGRISATPGDLAYPATADSRC